AHAKRGGIATSKAKEAPGVVAVVTAKALGGLEVPCPAAGTPGMKIPRQPVLATGKVRFVGEPVAAVVATSRYASRDAVDLIEVDYDPLEAVVDPEKAAQPGGPLVHDEFGDNIVVTMPVANPNVDEAFKAA